MIVLDDRRKNARTIFQHVQYVGTSADNPYALEKTSPYSFAEDRNSARWPNLAGAQALALAIIRHVKNTAFFCLVRRQFNTTA